MKRLTIFLMLAGFISTLGCSKNDSHSKESNLISIEILIDENSQFLFEGKKIDFENFSKVCANRINALAGQNINTMDIIVSLKAYKTVEMGLINDLQIELRNLDLKKIDYSTI